MIFFPGQQMDIDSHVALGKRFGKIENHPNLKNPFTQHDEVFELAATHGGVADEWHTDITFEDQPSIMSILHMVTCPEFGGDTMWTNLHQAYEELSPPMQALCDGLSALHDAHPHNREDQMAMHPVVRIHPESGKKVLYVNEHFTRRLVEMNATESKVVLEYLTEWVKNALTVRYHWTRALLQSGITAVLSILCLMTLRASALSSALPSWVMWWKQPDQVNGSHGFVRDVCLRRRA